MAFLLNAFVTRYLTIEAHCFSQNKTTYFTFEFQTTNFPRNAVTTQVETNRKQIYQPHTIVSALRAYRMRSFGSFFANGSDASLLDGKNDGSNVGRYDKCWPRRAMTQPTSFPWASRKLTTPPQRACPRAFRFFFNRPRSSVKRSETL